MCAARLQPLPAGVALMPYMAGCYIPHEVYHAWLVSDQSHLTTLLQLFMQCSSSIASVVHQLPR
jgi:hypothetical protein